MADTDYGRLLLDASEQGWNMGRQMVSDFRDTQELLKRRAQEEEAKGELGRIQGVLQANSQKYALAQEEHAALLAQQESGFEVDEREITLAEKTMDSLLQAQLTTVFDEGARLHVSPNPFLAVKGKELMDQGQVGLQRYQDMKTAELASATQRRGQDVASGTQIVTQAMGDAAAMDRARLQDAGEDRRADKRNKQDADSDRTRSIIAILGVAAAMGPEEAAKNPQLQHALKELGAPALTAPEPESPMTEERKQLHTQVKSALDRLNKKTEDGRPLSKKDQAAKRMLERKLKEIEDEDQDEAVRGVLDDRNWFERMFTEHPLDRPAEGDSPAPARHSAARRIAQALGVDDAAESGDQLQAIMDALAKADAKPAKKPRSKLQALGLAPEDATE